MSSAGGGGVATQCRRWSFPLAASPEQRERCPTCRAEVIGLTKDNYYFRIMDELYLNGYNDKLQPFAKKLRGDMTKAEACLWKYVLKSRMMKGYQFRRQRPVLNYIADFMCQELKLIIETDGLTHDFEEVYANDLVRQAKLEEAGFTVVRFNDSEVLNGIANVRQHIEHVIEELEKRASGEEA